MSQRRPDPELAGIHTRFSGSPGKEAGLPAAEYSRPRGPPAGGGRPAEETSPEHHPPQQLPASSPTLAPSFHSPSSTPVCSLMLPPPSPLVGLHAGPGHRRVIWTAAPASSPGLYPLPHCPRLPRRPSQTHTCTSLPCLKTLPCPYVLLRPSLGGAKAPATQAVPLGGVGLSSPIPLAPGSLGGLAVHMKWSPQPPSPDTLLTPSLPFGSAHRSH